MIPLLKHGLRKERGPEELNSSTTLGNYTLTPACIVTPSASVYYCTVTSNGPAIKKKTTEKILSKAYTGFVASVVSYCQLSR